MLLKSLQAFLKKMPASTSSPAQEIRTTAATKSKGRRVIWGLSLHGWEEVMRGSLAVVGVFGLLVGLATFFVVTLTREEAAESKRQLEEYKVEASKEVAAAVAIGETAKADAAKANEGASEANARAADLDKKAEELRAANLALEALIQPRRWNRPEEAKAFGEALSKFRGRTVKVSSQTGDVEAAVLAQQILIVLQHVAGISVIDRRAAEAPLGFVVLGVLVSGRDEELVSAILAALPPKLRAERGQMPAGAPGFSIQDPPGEIDATIVVGGKLLPDPPPQ